ncbi:EAL domain-containing protein [Thiorhodococcus mannitoliphagus]|uniref:cyclic-guanylate-specific phosphodiesterase n=1 Tax=Thiorhodococcus mannitoliphagus TaxID=329406 RepID=A0A6P1DN82_9GAMM|nr:EAL domain-containing protein [Thiorhodococcus mannitoliphagus]NEX19488.1 EAL domain-containing protein [Thiorhodococcus mannitoliphagus]
MVLFRTTPLRWLLLLVAVVFSFYLLLLLTNVYHSQRQLRAAAEARLLAESQQTATLIGDLLADQESFVIDLAKIHEIGTFLVNNALGMSMRYGLSTNLAAIEERFRSKLTQKRLLGADIYERILYVDEAQATLVDTDPDAALDPQIRSSDQEPHLMIDEAHGKIIASAPVRYRDKPGGFVITVSSLDLLSRYLTSSRVDLGFRQFLVAGSGQSLTDASRTLLDATQTRHLAALPPRRLIHVSELPSLATAPLAKDYDLVLRMPVAHSDLSVITVLPASLLYGHITSRGFLFFASSVPLILLFAALWLGRMRQRAQRLEADVLESNRNRAELQDRNDALTAEIFRRKTLEHQLRESEERYRTYIEHAPEGIFVSDNLGRLVDVNPSACVMVGYTRAELLTMAVTDLSPPDMVRTHADALEQVLANGRHELEIGLRRKDGTDIVGSLRAITLPDDLVMGFCVDITERKRAEEQIHSLAYFDPLTGLPNRRLLHDRLRQLMAGSDRNREYGAVMMLDLDRFKDLNDTQGHDIGDRLLAEVALRLVASVRREDTVARLGGDEYVIIAGELGTEESAAALQAEHIAEKVHRALDQPYALAEGRPAHHSSVSIGVALFCGRDLGVELLLKQADVALYQAKNAGRNTIRFFNPEMQAAIDARATLETALRRAIEHEELRLYFQPQVDQDGRVIGAEALLRWLPPGSAPVSPARFIPLAEETGLIIPIGIWVLEHACEQLRAWQANPQTGDLVLSINVSARQFHQPDFVDLVRDTIAASRVDARGLKLELTESLVLDRVDQVIGRMQTLKALGLGFSLDDFGTGYSSLSYLKRLPLDQVKIDQSFVRDLAHDQNDAAIVKAVLAMSQSLGLDAVAEGVETEDQRAFLVKHGCQQFQGFLFGKPVPIEDFPAPERLQPAPGVVLEFPEFGRNKHA